MKERKKQKSLTKSTNLRQQTWIIAFACWGVEGQFTEFQIFYLCFAIFDTRGPNRIYKMFSSSTLRYLINLFHSFRMLLRIHCLYQCLVNVDFWFISFTSSIGLKYGKELTDRDNIISFGKKQVVTTHYLLLYFNFSSPIQNVIMHSLHNHVFLSYKGHTWNGKSWEITP